MDRSKKVLPLHPKVNVVKSRSMKEIMKERKELRESRLRKLDERFNDINKNQ